MGCNCYIENDDKKRIQNIKIKINQQTKKKKMKK